MSASRARTECLAPGCAAPIVGDGMPFCGGHATLVNIQAFRLFAFHLQLWLSGPGWVPESYRRATLRGTLDACCREAIEAGAQTEPGE